MILELLGCACLGFVDSGPAAKGLRPREGTAKQKQVGAVYRKIMGTTFPAMTMVVVAGLVEDEALVEIEATAMIET